MTMASDTAVTTMAASSISIPTGRGHHPRRVSRQAQPTKSHRCLALQRKQQPQQLRRRPVVRSGSSAALCRWAGSYVAVAVVVFALGCHIPTASCMLAPRGIPADDRPWIRADKPSSPAHPEKILRYIHLTDRRMGGAELQNELLGQCISSSFQDLSNFKFSCESVTVNDYHVFYPAFQSTPAATLVTGAEALKEAMNATNGGCSRSRFVAAAYWKSVGSQRTADNPATRILFTISAMLAFRPKLSRLSTLFLAFDKSATSFFVGSEEEVEMFDPALFVFTTYGDFLSLELSHKAPKVARSLLGFMMRQIEGMRQRRRSEEENEAAAQRKKRQEEAKAKEDWKRDVIRVKHGLKPKHYKREDLEGVGSTPAAGKKATTSRKTTTTTTTTTTQQKQSGHRQKNPPAAAAAGEYMAATNAPKDSGPSTSQQQQSPATARRGKKLDTLGEATRRMEEATLGFAASAAALRQQNQQGAVGKLLSWVKGKF